MPHRIESDDTLTGEKRHPKRILIRTALLSWLGIIFTVGIFVFSIFPYMKTQLIREMDARARVIFSSISQVTISSILLEDYSSVVDHCITVVDENPSVLYTVITRHDGFSLVHTKRRWMQDNLDGMWKPIKGRTSETGEFLESDLVNREVFHVSHPFSYSGVDWGWIHIGLSPDNFYIDLKALYIKTFWLALLSISAGLVASYFFARRLTRPLLELDRLAQKVGTGDLSARIEISTDDELESLADSFNHMTEALQISQKELEATHKKLIKAQEDERQRISRELHDRVAQDMSISKIGCDLLLDNDPPLAPEVNQKVSEISNALNATILAVRDLAYDLRPPGLDDLGLIETIYQYCEDFSEKSGIGVEFHFAGMDNVRLDLEAEINLFRLIQECLNNVWKHADASHTTIRLMGAFPNVILRIKDNGKGFNVSQRSVDAEDEKRMGLRSMKERAGLLQGKLSIRSKRHEGTIITVKFPYAY